MELFALREVPSNLEIGLKTLVTRILFEDKTAVGVEAVRANRIFRIRARSDDFGGKLIDLSLIVSSHRKSRLFNRLLRSTAMMKRSKRANFWCIDLIFSKNASLFEFYIQL
jgi:hypothetical protein